MGAGCPLEHKAYDVLLQTASIVARTAPGHESQRSNLLPIIERTSQPLWHVRINDHLSLQKRFERGFQPGGIQAMGHACARAAAISTFRCLRANTHEHRSPNACPELA